MISKRFLTQLNEYIYYDLSKCYHLHYIKRLIQKQNNKRLCKFKLDP